MNTTQALDVASTYLEGVGGHTFDLLSVAKPVSTDAALNLAKVISKLSPLTANLIEFTLVDYLNEQPEFAGLGEWVRQDPGFPDVILPGIITPTPGFEVKAWFPLSTEITARFKDSQNHFRDNNIRVCVLAWLPDSIIYGKPRVLDVCVLTGASMAQARDNHYHNPPDYLVLEPEDTTKRTRNLQQTNTNGHKWQGTAIQLAEAERIVASWGPMGERYQPTPEYQALLRELMSRFPYRLDTNYAKIDRIAHPGLEAFKRRVLSTQVEGLNVAEWVNLFASGANQRKRRVLREYLDITEAEVERILE